jgi:hypothetical protein
VLAALAGGQGPRVGDRNFMDSGIQGTRASPGLGNMVAMAELGAAPPAAELAALAA